MKEILTVSQFNNNIKLLFEETFNFLWVEGEVSNLRRPQSGHVYFTLNDDKSLAQRATALLRQTFVCRDFELLFLLSFARHLSGVVAI